MIITPLAAKMRPRQLSDLLGQEHLFGRGQLLARAIENKRLPSFILWGPPGCGKTSIAEILSKLEHVNWIKMSGVTGGVKDIRDAAEGAQGTFQSVGKQTCLFIDEIHRLNQSQQDVLLPYVENGTLTLIGATTSNPSFSVNRALLSRCRVFTLNALTHEQLDMLVERALVNLRVSIEAEARKHLIASSQGDARSLLSNIELAAQGVNEGDEIQLAHVEAAIGQVMRAHDKKGSSHYDVTSAFIKSMRANDPDAALRHLVHLIEGGDDPLFILRRMIIFASEDVGHADPQAIQVVAAALESFRLIGFPEGFLPLAHAATYLACAPKSRSVYDAYQRAKTDPFAVSKEPYFQPTQNGYERFIFERLEKIRARTYDAQHEQTQSTKQNT